MTAAYDSDADTILALARHGETEWHAVNRYAGGRSDIDLTARGEEQARELALWTRARKPSSVFSSPVRRAFETAEASAVVLGGEPVVVEALREVDFGIAEGRTLLELADSFPEMVRGFLDDPVAHPFPGAESPIHAADRCARALREIASGFPGATVLVVAHNTILRMGLCQLLGVPVARYRDLFPRLDNAALTEIRVPADPRRPASLLSLNIPARSDMKGRP